MEDLVEAETYVAYGLERCVWQIPDGWITDTKYHCSISFNSYRVAHGTRIYGFGHLQWDMGQVIKNSGSRFEAWWRYGVTMSHFYNAYGWNDMVYSARSKGTSFHCCNFASHAVIIFCAAYVFKFITLLLLSFCYNIDCYSFSIFILICVETFIKRSQRNHCLQIPNLMGWEPLHKCWCSKREENATRDMKTRGQQLI